MSKNINRTVCTAALALVQVLVGCDANDSIDTGNGSTGGASGQAGSAGASTAGVGGAGGRAPGGAGSGGQSAGAGGGGGSSGRDECGDPEHGGVIVFEDVTQSTRWDCPLYTLTKPVLVRSSTNTRSVLTIAPGVKLMGVAGDLEAAKLPGALIVTRSGSVEASGTADKPIVFTSAKPEGDRAPGDWGGVVLLGGAPTNVPANYENAGNAAGEMFIEGLPRSELLAYGAEAPQTDDSDGLAGAAGAAGSGGSAGAAGAAGSAGSPARPWGDEDWSCGTLRYVRIEFAGFEVASGKELNGLSVAGCGRDTRIEYVQVHQSSDDGIELFGGTADLHHVVVTGAKDDSLDWDQGWRGRMQFVALRMDDDSHLPAANKGDSAIEGDGWADPNQRLFQPSRALIYNLTLLASSSSQRGIRLREGTQVTIRNAIIAAPDGGASAGLLDLSDAITADWIQAGELRVENTIFFGSWPASGQADSLGTLYVEADWFTRGGGSSGNDEPTLFTVLPEPGRDQKPGWVPAANTLASTRAVPPAEPDATVAPFFETSAVYRGAFAPGGSDWTEGWTSYTPD